MRDVLGLYVHFSLLTHPEQLFIVRMKRNNAYLWYLPYMSAAFVIFYTVFNYTFSMSRDTNTPHYVIIAISVWYSNT